jgi:hypothetical protein
MKTYEDKVTQVAFVGYALGAWWLEDTLAKFPGAIVIKGAHGYQVWTTRK